jgi:hypothetical protein
MVERPPEGPVEDGSDGPTRSIVDTAREGSGIATAYLALDRLVSLYELDDAAVVVDVPGLGRQVLHAGRRPLRERAGELVDAEPGLYLQPPLEDPVVTELVLAVSALGLRCDARLPRTA